MAVPLLFSPFATAESASDNWNDQVGVEVNSLANSIDSYFGEIRADDESSGSTLRLAPQFQAAEYATPQSTFDMRLNLKLRNLEKLGQDVSDKVMQNTQENLDRVIDGDQPATHRDRQWGWSRNLETRVAGVNPVNYGSLVRIRRNFQDDLWVHRFWWSGGWSNDLLWLTEANFSSDYALQKYLLFRWINQWTDNLSSSLQTTSHGPSLFQSITDNLSVSYDARVNMAIEAGAWVLNDYSFGTAVRRRLRNRWIFLELDTGVDFARQHSFARQLNVLAKIEFVFGSI